MKPTSGRWHSVAIGAALLLVAASAAGLWWRADTAGARATPRQTPVGARGTVSHLSLPSGDANGARRAVWVYRPPVPDRATLPVVYFLHGHPGGAGDLGDEGVARLLDARFAAGAAPFVLVVPDGNDADGDDTEWADSADGSVQLESFVVATLIPAVEGAHRRPTADRALVGFSMGGYGAVNIALHHPGLCTQVASIAGYYVVDDPDGVGRSDPAWRRHNDPGRHLAAVAGRRFFLVRPDGDDHSLMEGEDERLAPQLRRAGAATVTVRERAGQHDLAFVTSVLPGVFDFLGHGWRR